MKYIFSALLFGPLQCFQSMGGIDHNCQPIFIAPDPSTTTITITITITIIIITDMD